MKRLIILTLAALGLEASAQNRIEKEIVNEINRLRLENGLSKVSYSAELSKASRHHARWMSITGIMSHDETCKVGSLKTLRDLEDRFKEYDVFNGAVQGGNENITFGWQKADPAVIAKDIVRGWSNSETHRKNMLESVGDGIELVIGISVYCEPGKDTERDTAVVMNLGIKK